MTVRRILSAVAVLIAVLAGAGCGERGAPLPAETDEPAYVQGKQLMKQGRNPEALTYFLKVIDRRGERGAPESHLEAGYIYLFHTKDPVEAYHHFRKYLDLLPNSKEAPGVRGKVEDAKREFARTLPARPLDDQSMKLQSEETIALLQRENAELRAQIATMRGNGAMATSRVPMINLPEETQTRAPPPPITAVVDSPITAAPLPRAAASPGVVFQSPAKTQPAQRATATTPTRPAAPTQTASAARTHAVAPKDTLYSISMKYYGNGRQVNAIYQANRDIMKSEKDVRPGMTLRIPALDATGAPRR